MRKRVAGIGQGFKSLRQCRCTFPFTTVPARAHHPRMNAYGCSENESRGDVMLATVAKLTFFAYGIAAVIFWICVRSY